ncbi:unnamed protein product [Paramecium sonneborni]|uniref:Uncharacterized protein n=1 Tax=Paramecium sonneborni TaxID=65129 RepID=A0A8S1QYV4_9CILI|nr:unnamed protein product [Paramecium sonneborni]
MKQKPKLQSGYDFINANKFTNQLRILNDSIHQITKLSKAPDSPFNNAIIKKCLTQQSQSPKQRRIQYGEFKQQTCTKTTCSPVSKEQLYNFSSEKKQKDYRFNQIKQIKQIQYIPVVQSNQRYKRQQFRNNLLLISKDLNNTQINEIIQQISK